MHIFKDFDLYPSLYSRVYTLYLPPSGVWESLFPGSVSTLGVRFKTKQQTQTSSLRQSYPHFTDKNRFRTRTCTQISYGLIHVPWGFPSNQYVGDTGLMPLTDHFWGLLGSLGWWPLAWSSLLWTHSSFSSHHCIRSLISYWVPWDGNDWEAQIIFIKRDRLGM